MRRHGIARPRVRSSGSFLLRMRITKLANAAHDAKNWSFHEMKEDVGMAN